MVGVGMDRGLENWVEGCFQRFTESELCHFIFILWGIREVRNKKCWQRSSLNPREGLYAWDRIGSIMAIGAVGKVGDVLPREAEALAVRDALSWLKGQAFDGVLIEIVALQIIN
nr:uncharacterized protein LOC109167502 [Ipomoea trifida]